MLARQASPETSGRQVDGNRGNPFQWSFVVVRWARCVTATDHRGTEAPRENRNEFLGVSVSRWYVAAKGALADQSYSSDARTPGADPVSSPRERSRCGCGRRDVAPACALVDGAAFTGG